MSSDRERRRHRREGMRSKSTGVGLSIDISASSSKKKIVFDEDAQVESHPAEDPKDIAVVAAEESDEDDAVEEVKGSDAKKLAQEQRTQERTVARESIDLKSKRKRKSRIQQKTEEEEEEDFDDEFFEKLDAEMVERREKRKKESKIDDAPKGRHTTFVASDGALDEHGPVKVSDNIDVVVLRNEPLLEAANDSIPVSKTALVFSRSQMVDGADVISEKQIRKAKKQGQDVKKITSTWKRSKKMNHLLLPGAKSQRRKGVGVPAAHFVVKM